VPPLYFTLVYAWPLTKRSWLAAVNQHALRDLSASLDAEKGIDLHSVRADGTMGLSYSHPTNLRSNGLTVHWLSWNHANRYHIVD